MNTTFSIRVDEKLKKSFLETTKTKGFDGAILIRHFMKKISNNPDLIQFDGDESIFDDLFKNELVIKKIEKISNKLDDLGF